MMDRIAVGDIAGLQPGDIITIHGRRGRIVAVDPIDKYLIIFWYNWWDTLEEHIQALWDWVQRRRHG